MLAYLGLWTGKWSNKRWQQTTKNWQWSSRDPGDIEYMHCKRVAYNFLWNSNFETSDGAGNWCSNTKMVKWKGWKHTITAVYSTICEYCVWMDSVLSTFFFFSETSWLLVVVWDIIWVYCVNGNKRNWPRLNWCASSFSLVSVTFLFVSVNKYLLSHSSWFWTTTLCCVQLAWL